MQRKTKYKRLPKPAIAIVGDGLCEQIYFQQLKEAERISHVRMRPELPDRSGKGGGFMRVFSKAEHLKEQGFDEVFCLVDMDVVYKEGKLPEYRKERENIIKKEITVLECNPCFEVWFLLHFIQYARLSIHCDEISKELRRNTDLNDYAKDENYFRRKNLYQALRKRLLSDAIPNAEWLEKQQSPEQSQRFPRCEVHKIVSKILRG